METISFRVGEELKKELAFVTASLKSTQSQAIKDAIHAFYLHLQTQEKSKKSPQQIFKESGYIGSFQINKGLSGNYKNDLTKRLKSKHEG